MKVISTNSASIHNFILDLYDPDRNKPEWNFNKLNGICVDFRIALIEVYASNLPIYFIRLESRFTDVSYYVELTPHKVSYTSSNLASNYISSANFLYTSYLEHLTTIKDLLNANFT